MPSQEIRLSPQQRRTALQVLDRNRLSQLTEQLGLETLSAHTTERPRLWAIPPLVILILLLTSIGVSGCLDSSNCTPADTTHSCCVKNHLADPGACDAIEGTEGVAFRSTTTNQGTISGGKAVAITAGTVTATGAAAVLVTMNDAARFKKLLVELDRLMEECANRAEQKINQEYLGGKILD